METVNVLWIDDKHDSEAEGFKFLALNYNVKLTAFKSLQGGMQELEKNYHIYDGIILDGKFLKEEDDSPGTEDIKNLREARDRINALPKKFKIFILSGILDPEQESTRAIADKIYDRKDIDDQKQILIDVRNSCEQQPDYQIRNKYKTFFEIDNPPYLVKNVTGYLLNTFSLLEYKYDPIKAKENLNSMRKVLEAIFESFYKNNIIPSKIYYSDGKINKCTKYLGNCTHLTFAGNQEVIKTVLTEFMNSTQEGSHYFSSVENHLNKDKSPYFFKSLVFQFCQLILWYKSCIDNNKFISKNESFICVGKIIKKENHDFAFLNQKEIKNPYIESFLVKKHNLTDGQQIKCEVEENEKGFKVKTILENLNY